MQGRIQPLLPARSSVSYTHLDVYKRQEWDEVEQWVWDNWDDVVALSFLSYDDSFYELMAYEAIDEAEYERRRAGMKPFKPALLFRYEREETELDLGDP